MERIELAKCPKCVATCRVGHDDDWQVFCACCHESFTPKETDKVTPEEYRMMLGLASKIYSTSAWTAFRP